MSSNNQAVSPTGWEEGGLSLVEEAVDSLSVGVAILDDDWDHVYANRSYIEIYGYDDPHDLMGESWDQLYQARRDDRVESQIPPAVVDRGEWSGNIIGTQRDGTTVYTNLALTEIDTGHIVCRVQDIAHDDSDIHEFQRYETILENIHDGVYTLDANGRITWVNEVAVEDYDLGYDRDDLIGAPVSKVLSPEDIKKCVGIIRELIAGDDRSRRCEITIQTAHGEDIPCDLHIALLPFTDGEFQGTIGVVRDITERKQQEQRLAVLNRVLRHNVRNDMNVIMGEAEWLEDTVEGPPAESARIIREAAHGLVRMSDTARRIEDTLNRENDDPLRPVNATDIIKTRAKVFRDRYPTATVTIAGAADVYVAADDMFDTVIDNLIANAIEHNDKQCPAVDISITSSDAPPGLVEIEIADNGPGIPARETDVLVDGEETSLHHGSGLGLWCVKWLVNHYGGTLDFADREPHGSVVTLRLQQSRQYT